MMLTADENISEIDITYIPSSWDNQEQILRSLSELDNEKLNHFFGNQ